MAGLEPIEELLRIAIGQNVGSASVGLVVRVLVATGPEMRAASGPNATNER